MRRLADWVRRDHRYVYLGGSVLAALGVLFALRAPSGMSFLPENGAAQWLLLAVCAAYLVLSAFALLVKLTHWKTYDATVMKRPGAVRFSRWFSYGMTVAFVVLLLDRGVLALASAVDMSISADSKPQEFFSQMVYYAWKGRSFYARGIVYTVELALFGTAIAFVLAVLVVFLRIQTPDRRDNDLVRFLKTIGMGFAKLYILIIRGTPMMVQGMIVFFGGFAILKAQHPGMSTTEINAIWTTFNAGLITISLNSTAYLAEVLRGGISAVDPGQMEAAHSLGMTNWKAMLKVVFPQAVKNSIPAIGNEFIINIKDSSVLSAIGLFELMYATTSIIGIYYVQLPLLIVTAIVYLILTYLSSLLMNAISAKLDAPVREIPSSN